MKIIVDENVKPKFPLGRLLFEPSFGGLCVCESSYKFSFPFMKKKCIQPNCEHYYKGFPSEDLDMKRAVCVNGKMESRWRIEDGEILNDFDEMVECPYCLDNFHVQANEFETGECICGNKFIIDSYGLYEKYYFIDWR